MTHPLWRALRAAARLACPRCGERTVFRGAFAMHERCAACHLHFEREPGYFVGAIYINYAATAILMMTGYVLLDVYTTLSVTTLLVIWSVFGIVFPLAFFRYSRSLWLAIDHLFDPEESRPRIAGRRRV